jgi:type IV secretory pathway VirB10-like protein
VKLILFGIVVLVALGVVVYLWWQRTPLTPQSLARRAPLPPMMSLRKSTVLIAAILVLLLCAGTVAGVRALWPSRKRTAVPVESPMTRPTSPASSFLDRFPAEYTQIAKAEAALPPKGVPVIPPPSGPTGSVTTAEGTGVQPARDPRQDVQNAQILAALQSIDQTLKAQQMTQRVAVGTTATPGQPAGTPPPLPSKKKKWESLVKEDAQQEQAGLSPEQQQELATEQQGRDIIHRARWAIPESPLVTLYRSQTLAGRLLQSISSDIPGQVKIQITAPVLDRFGYDTTIIPKDSIVIASQEGKPTYGTSRLNIRLEQLEFPSGEVVQFKAAIGSEDGANGLEGKTNNHYGKLILATGLSALLNIGIRTAAGTPGRGYQYQDPMQSAAQDVGQSVQRDAQSIVDRELHIPPTITVKAGEFCTINLQENIQFSKNPVVVR